MSPSPRVHGRARPKSLPNALEWLATAAVAALLGAGAVKMLRADDSPPNAAANVAALIRTLGTPTGVLAVINPATCALNAEDAAALNQAAAVPGLRVTVLLVAVAPHDSVLQRVRSDFALAPGVHVASASLVNPRLLPDVFRVPFVALIVRGQLRHAAWGESLKSLSEWLPSITGAGT